MSTQDKPYRKIPRRPYALSRAGVDEVLALLKNSPGEADEDVLDAVCEALDAPERGKSPQLTVWLSRNEREAVLDAIDDVEPNARMAQAAVRSLDMAIANANAPERLSYGLPSDLAEDLLAHLQDPCSNEVLSDRAAACLQSSVSPSDLDPSFVLVWLSDDERNLVLGSFSDPDVESCGRVARYFEKRVASHRERLQRIEHADGRPHRPRHQRPKVASRSSRPTPVRQRR